MAIYAIPVAGPGSLFIMPCPTPDSFEHMRALGVTAVLSMLPEDEAREMNMTDEATLCTAMGITFINHPIPDFGLSEVRSFDALIADIKQRIEGGAQLAVHCRAGIGRSGMVAACTLIALGSDAQDAVAAVSLARGVAIPDTIAQEDFITSFSQRLN